MNGHGQAFCPQKVLLDFNAYLVILSQWILAWCMETLNHALSLWVYQDWHCGVVEPQPLNKPFIHLSLNCGDKCYIK
jgi:hypothetical protein